MQSFINASIVAFSSSAPGTTAQIQVPDQLKTTQDVKKTSTGKRYVTQDVEKDTWN